MKTKRTASKHVRLRRAAVAALVLCWASALPGAGLASGQDPAPDACAKAYHGALADIGQARVGSLDTLLKSSHSGSRALPGRWTFLPGNTQHGTPERAVVTRANTLVRYRGADPGLRQLALSPALARTVADLKAYTSQALTAALCTGADAYMDFFTKQLSGLFEKRGELARLADQAAGIADTRLDEAEKVLKSPLDRAEDDGREAFEAQAETLAAGLADARNLWSKLSGTASDPDAGTANISALGDIRKRIGTIGADRRSAIHPLRAALHGALSYLEAAAYIHSARARYEAVASGFASAIQAVRDANAQACTCQH